MKCLSHPHEYAIWLQEVKTEVQRLRAEILAANRWHHFFTKKDLSSWRWQQSIEGKIKPDSRANIQIQILRGYLDYVKQ
jgi:hypothetical protein